MEYRLDGSGGVVALDGPMNTIGVMPVAEISDNQTRRTAFSPSKLQQWAQAVGQAYGGEAEIVFTPNKPMIAVPYNTDALVGIGIAPRVRREDKEDDS